VRRTWVDVADVVLGAAMLLVAVLAGADGRLLDSTLAAVLGLAWGARGVAGLRRRPLRVGLRPGGSSGSPRPATR
jgi:hypothetical protein